jgi:hypothetical protein
MAETQFQTGPDGRRWFFFGGLMSRPFIVPSAEVEQRIVAREIWFWRAGLGIYLGFSVGYEIVYFHDCSGRQFLDHLSAKPLWLLGFAIALLAALRTMRYALLRKELLGLSRLEQRPSLRTVYSNHVKRLSLPFILLGCLAMVVADFILATGYLDLSLETRIVPIIVVSAAAGAYGLMLLLKLKSTR